MSTPPHPTSLKPSILEIGPGRGDFLFHLAKENPLKQIVAIEYKKKRYDKLIKRSEPYPNVALHFGNARLVLPELFPNECFEEIYILFSDPWPKKRHAKHRLFQEGFLKNLHASLMTGGRVIVATDDPHYQLQIQEVFQNSPFTRLTGNFHFPTFYAEKWAKEGRSFYSFIYQKGNLSCFG